MKQVEWNGGFGEKNFTVGAWYGPIINLFRESYNLFGHLGHFIKCQAPLQMTMEVTSN